MWLCGSLPIMAWFLGGFAVLVGISGGGGEGVGVCICAKYT